MKLPFAVSLLVALRLISPVTAEEPGSEYLSVVKPVIEKRCLACHGALKQKSGLRLDTVSAMRKGGEGGPVIEPGSGADSLLIDALEGTAGFRMPPEGEPLSATEIGAIRSWIDSGAAAPSDEKPQADPSHFWAFLPPIRPPFPNVSDATWVHTPIDAFIAAEHQSRGLTPSPPASRAEWLRRVSLDLTGLAPTVAELHEYVNDPSPEAEARVVDRLLASPHYGERWGRHWMDVWRYSDWDGYAAEVRSSKPHIWRWRDWIIENLNADTGYDRMVVAMLAGDEVAPDDPDTLRATGYLVRNWFKFNRNVWLQDTVDHTAKAFLGLTVACARCHDHKYDPIAQTDWYRFRAFFEPHDVRTDSVPGQADTAKDGLVHVYDAKSDTQTFLFGRGDEAKPDKEHPLTPGLPAVFHADLSIQPTPISPQGYYPGLREHTRREVLQAADAAVSLAETQLADARKAADAAKSEQATRAVTLAERSRDAALGERESVRDRLAADSARYLDEPDSKRADILAIVAGHAERQAALSKALQAKAKAEFDLLAAQLAVDANPSDAAKKTALETAKAAAGTATTALDAAGTKASQLARTYTPFTPVYPSTSTGRRLALARWITSRDNPLAARVAVNQIWMRHFGEPLVATVFDFGLNGTPPSHPALLDWLAVEFMENGWSMKHVHRLIVLSNAYRMQSSGKAEDPNLAIDPANTSLWRMNVKRMEAEVLRDNVLFVSGGLDPSFGGPDLDQNTGLTTTRRSVYYRHATEKRMLFLSLFDSANTAACYRRDKSIIPQQALAMANSPMTLSRARLLARDLAADAGGDESRFIASAFERILNRAATDEERLACDTYLREQTRILADRSTLTPFADGAPAPVAASPEANLRARENLVHVLLNHHEFVTIH